MFTEVPAEVPNTDNLSPEERISYIQVCRRAVQHDEEIDAEHLRAALACLRANVRVMSPGKKPSKAPVAPVSLDDI